MAKKLNLILFINIVFFVFNIFVISVYFTELEFYIKVLGYGLTSIFFILETVFYILKKELLYKSFFIFNVFCTIIIFIFFILNVCGIFYTISDLEKIKLLIIRQGNVGYLFYILIQILNVVILPMPAFVFHLAGTAIFGSIIAFLLGLISGVIGSIICYLIGRKFGSKVAVWCIGKNNLDKYLNIIGKKGYFLFAVMQLFPFFPDDMLCIVAGVLSMNFPFFIITIIFTRGIYIFFACFLGSGSIIPFTGWGLYVWIVIGILSIISFVLFCKYQTKIENYFIKSKKKNKKV